MAAQDQGRPVDPRTVQNQAQQIEAAKLAQARKIIDDLPQIEEKALRSIDLSDKLEKRNKELDLLMTARQEKVEELGVAMTEAEHEFKYAKEAADLAQKHAKEWEETIRQQTEMGKVKRPWNWKRTAWAVASSCVGVATAFFLRKRAPIMNAAAGGCALASVARKVPGFKNHDMIASAGGALATHWAHQQDNMVGLVTETVLAGAAYSELTFNVGEAAAEGAVEAVRSLKESYKKTKEEIEKEGGDR